MNRDEREEIRSHFQEVKAQLTSHLPSLRVSSQPVAPDPALGRLTRMEAIQDMEINANALRQVKSQLVALGQALDRIDEPGFGVCSECENAIPLGRLKAVPGSLFCVNCV